MIAHEARTLGWPGPSRRRREPGGWQAVSRETERPPRETVDAAGGSTRKHRAAPPRRAVRAAAATGALPTAARSLAGDRPDRRRPTSLPLSNATEHARAVAEGRPLRRFLPRPRNAG